MRIGGFQKLTLVDFPGTVAATVFTQGCNFRCGYCHNPQLVMPQSFQAPLDEDAVLNFLKGRHGKIDGVVITGGEPTLQHGLIDFVMRLKDMGFKVKLDTNGSHPEVLSTLFELHLIDYVAMDVKTSLDRYSQLTRVACDTAKVQESISMIINSRVPYQMRTTLVKSLCTVMDLEEIRLLLADADHYVLQPFVQSQKMLDSNLMDQVQYSSMEVESLKAQFELKGRP